MELSRRSLEAAVEAFLGDAAGAEITRIPYGHINDTFKVVLGGRAYILQRINDSIFKNPRGLVENISKVTLFLREKIVASGGDPERETLTLLKTDNDDYLYTDENGYFRMYRFITGATCYNRADRPGLFGESAKAFGRFQNLLSDFDAKTLHETIKDFHNTPVRYANLASAVAKDIAGRNRDCGEEIEFYLSRRDFCPLITDRLADGRLPTRVTHNDTKLNNVMIDDKTGKGICVIDLDTVMPGSLLYDYGDSIRFGASSAAEDEKDLSRVYMVPSLFREYTGGFLSEAKEKLTAEEKALLPEGAIMMTLECGMRFLTDYLENDIYFHTSYDGQNLDRARTQMKLVADMESKLDDMRREANSF